MQISWLPVLISSVAAPPSSASNVGPRRSKGSGAEGRRASLLRRAIGEKNSPLGTRMKSLIQLRKRSDKNK